jgi:hypothetical protein
MKVKRPEKTAKIFISLKNGDLKMFNVAEETDIHRRHCHGCHNSRWLRLASVNGLCPIFCFNYYGMVSLKQTVIELRAFNCYP